MSAVQLRARICMTKQQRDRDDHERVPARAQHDRPTSGGEDARDDAAERHEAERVDALAELVGQTQRGPPRVGADAEERALAERDVAGVAGDDVPAHRLIARSSEQDDDRSGSTGCPRSTGKSRTQRRRPATRDRPTPRVERRAGRRARHARHVLPQPRPEQALRPDQQHDHDHDVETTVAHCSEM